MKPHRHDPRRLRDALLLTALLVAASLGCGPTVWEPQPDIPAHVEYDTVRIEYGEEDALPETPEGMVQQALVGDASAIATLTQETVANTNLAIYKQLTFIEEIKQYPPTSFDNEEGWWEWVSLPTAERYTRVRIERVEQLETDDPDAVERLRYELFHGLSAEDNEKILDGEFTRFERNGDRQQGFGILRLYFDRLRRYDDTAPRGVMRISFRSNGQVRQVRVGLFRAFQFSGQEALNAIYRYEQLPDGQGRLQYFGRGSINGDREREFLSISSAWTARRAGFASIRATGGSLRLDEMRLAQCWDEEGIVTFSNTDPDVPSLEGGTREDCAPPLRSLDFEPPVYAAPEEADPAIPAAHPDEQ